MRLCPHACPIPYTLLVSKSTAGDIAKSLAGRASISELTPRTGIFPCESEAPFGTCVYAARQAVSRSL
jgi:hypothetical protein